MTSSLADIKYWTYHDHAKRSAIFIHGFTGSHDGFQYIIPHLKQFHVIAPDLPGFGESKLWEDTWTIDELARRVNEFVRELGLSEPPFLISHSMGGLVAASMLAQAPELFQKKTVFISPVATNVRLLDSRKIGALLGSLQYRVGKNVPHIGPKVVKSRRFSKLATKFIMTADHPELRSKIYEHHYKNLDYISSIDFYYQLHRDINRRGVTDYIDKLKKFSILIIAGEKDNVTPLKGEKILAERLGAKLSVIPGVGHLAHYEAPEKISSALIDFLG